MTKRLVIVEGGVVVNSFFADSWPGAVEHDEACTGWTEEEGVLVPPVTITTVSKDEPITKLSFIRIFSLSERIHMTSSDDPIIQDGLLMLQVAEDISLTDPDTVAFVMYARDNGYITTERAEEILTNL